ncbi:trans-sulfuration enzyme family protein [Liquorilactobacillus uvarum]|uniref:Cystathionine beta-lyase n=1 Tax=Liquorilactobacillus uvarum DSM 19971 TaxID=1423812 RepID=A0A0R1PPS2_9LACO|nr:PLP-dependent aspartate aminotransferase family protein [Liquorilactobacillus uvarum]KRL34270.1 cystathionine beta-lyase [Liquorilactobacillus uvarum DSM 19971]
MANFDTNLVHGKCCNDNNTGAVNVPIYNSSTYVYQSADAKVKWDYARSGNPTRAFLEEQIALLEGGKRGFAFSSGLAAIHAAFAIFEPGDHIIIGDKIYGGTFRLINQYFKRWQLEFTTVDTQDSAAVEAAVQSNTKAIYFETFTNPLLRVTSVKAMSEIAQRHHLLTIVDNTFLTPYLQQPLKLGADVVIHSATKYLGGHSDVIAGLVVVKNENLAEKIYFSQNALGGVLSPEDSNLIRRGIQTLGVRMDRHLTNAAKIVDFLSKRSEIARVYYPGIKGSADHEIAKKECRGFGGIVSFDLIDAIDSKAFVERLNLFKLAVSLGAVESLVELPYKMSHAELSAADLKECGISTQLIRLSVGIEDAADLVADLTQALDSFQK